MFTLLKPRFVREASDKVALTIIYSRTFDQKGILYMKVRGERKAMIVDKPRNIDLKAFQRGWHKQVVEEEAEQAQVNNEQNF